MKKILRGPKVYRIKCPICDCEFEYDYSDVITLDLVDLGLAERYSTNYKIVQCPHCKSSLDHKDSISTTTQVDREDSMFT